VTWIIQAIRDEAERVRAAAPSIAPCEVCGGDHAAQYIFGYARVSGQSTEYTGTGTKTTTYYDSVAARGVWLCDRCLVPVQKSLAARHLRMAVGIIVVSLIVAILIGLLWRWDLALPILFAGLLILIFPYLQRRRVLRDLRMAGQFKAQQLHEQELRLQGYDAFWSDPWEVYGKALPSS